MTRRRWRHFDRWFALAPARCWRCAWNGLLLRLCRVGAPLSWHGNRWGYCAKHWDDAWDLAGLITELEADDQEFEVERDLITRADLVKAAGPSPPCYWDAPAPWKRAKCPKMACARHGGSPWDCPLPLEVVDEDERTAKAIDAEVLKALQSGRVVTFAGRSLDPPESLAAILEARAKVAR